MEHLADKKARCFSQELVETKFELRTEWMFNFNTISYKSCLFAITKYILKETSAMATIEFKVLTM